MRSSTVLLVFGVLLLLGGGAFVALSMSAEDVPVGRWDTADEVEVDDPAEDAATETAEMTGSLADRTAIDTGSLTPDGDERRVDVILRGRVVSKFQGPVANAKVWLDFGRGGQRGFDRGGPGGGQVGGPGGRNRRVPDPVVTDAAGRFAFQGRTFRELRVILQVAHGSFAPGVFDKNLGVAQAEMDVGDLVLNNGGVATGRVTDLDGNGIAGATLRLSPENGNQMRWTRDREQLTPDQQTDNNGFYRLQHIPAGEWRINASAKMHVDGSSTTFAIEEDLQIEVADIELGPGYDLAGFVTDAAGKPIAKAEVTLRSRGRDNGNGGGQGGGPGGGRGGRAQGGQGGGPGGGGGRDHRATTDDKGFFVAERLPGAPLEMTVDAKGFLTHRQDGIDAKLGQKVYVTLQDGLKLVGTVTDQKTGQPVTEFAVRALRVRGLPVPGMENVDPADIFARMRDGNLDEATRTQLRQQMEASFGGRGRDGGAGGRGGRGGGPGGDMALRFGGDLGKPEHHDRGEFAVTGLQEGVYVLAVQSPQHASFRSKEVELRLGAAAPTLTVVLDPGVSVSGIVKDPSGAAIANARVELRTATREENTGANAGNSANGNGGRGGRGNRLGEMMRQFGGGGGTSVVDARTDKHGRFRLEHAPRGTYRVRASADGHDVANSDVLDVQADLAGIELTLGSLGALAGRVLGVTPQNAAEARVVAVPAGSQGFNFRDGRPFADVQPDGTYRIENLTPGGYVVRAFVGSPRDLMSELGPQFLDSALQAEVTVAAGKTTDHDVTLKLPETGTVAGSVLHNGNPATGFQVALSRTDETAAAGNTANTEPGGGRGRGGRGGPFGGGGSRSFQASVGPSGRFSIGDVPAGNYRLVVSNGRRGSNLLEQAVQVFTGQTTELNLSVMTSSVKGTVTTDDGTPVAELGGSVVLLADMTALPADWNPRRGQGGGNTPMARLQNGSFELESVKPGQYLVVLSARGRERVTQSVFVPAGQTQALQLVAGKKTATDAPGGTPTNGGGTNPQPRARGGDGNGNGGAPRNAQGQGGRGNQGGRGGDPANQGQGGGRRGG
ncbi:MAG: hypothetical protein IPK26_01245 [Planctomycetes bacterium]|nr:hypothetical protein [Planctomycetota bacterium]